MPESIHNARSSEGNSGPSPLAELAQLLRKHQHFVVTSHARPDGDAIGSALGMMHLLEALGKQVEVAFADPIPGIYQGLPGAERIVHEIPGTPFDAAVLLECDSIARSGFERIDAPVTINIDHHLSGRAFADFNWIDPQACAVGEMVYAIAAAMDVMISSEMATCLFAAVLTDTGSFTYQCTSAATFRLATHLVEAGANPNQIAQQVYFSNPASKMHLLGKALGHLKADDGLAWSWVTLEDMRQSGADIEDCEGVVNHFISIAGVVAAVFLRELPDGMFRLSIRSKGNVNVARVAESFGGGGHRNASGCTIDGPLQAALDAVLARLREQAVPLPA